MSRPKTDNVKLQVSIQADTMKGMESYCTSAGVSKSFLVNYLLKRFLNSHKNIELFGDNGEPVIETTAE